MTYKDKPLSFPVEHLVRNGSVSEIIDRMPHVVVRGIKGVHVFPVRVFRDVANGRIPWSDIEDGDDFIGTVIAEWLDNLRK